MKYSTRSELLPEAGILGIELLLRFLFGIEVIEIPEELVETMHRRKKLIAIAKVVLTELPAGVP
jgi:hypothetical protein